MINLQKLTSPNQINTYIHKASSHLVNWHIRLQSLIIHKIYYGLKWYTMQLQSHCKCNISIRVQGTSIHIPQMLRSTLSHSYITNVHYPIHLKWLLIIHGIPLSLALWSLALHRPRLYQAQAQFDWVCGCKGLALFITFSSSMSINY